MPGDFEVGDVVICIDQTPLTWSKERVFVGLPYTVREITDDGGIRLIGGSVAWTTDRFALAAADPAPMPSAADPVNHPAHYRLASGVEVIDVTEQLDFLRGNAVKYLARAGRKDGADELEDLKKAAWYVARAVTKLEQERSA